MTAASGRVIGGRYRLAEQLGRGGMGIVWLAHDDVLDRTVALKEVVASAGASADARERMLREARAAARLDHPGAVRIYDVVDPTEEQDAPWIVMEVLTGRTLKDTVREDGPLSPRRVAEVGLALVDAIGAAHRAGIVHRDVKPANVQLCDDGRVVLTDFGIAQVTGDSSITRTGDLVGSPAYMSPERARGEPLGPESDLFSLGATLYAAVEGASPFERETPIATLTAIVHEPPAPCRRAGALAPLIDGLLAKNPADRLTEAETRERLMAISRGDDTEQTAAWAPIARDDDTRLIPEPSSRATRAPRRRRVGTAVFVLVVLAAAGGVGGWLADRHHHANTKKTASTGPLTPGHGGIPADWLQQHAPDGWSVATPSDFHEQRAGSTVRYRRDNPYAYVSVLTETGSDPRAVLTQVSGQFATHQAYRQVASDTEDFRGRPLPRLTFSYRDQGADLEASWLAVPANGHVYLVWWQTLTDGWDSALRLRTQIESTVRLPGQ